MLASVHSVSFWVFWFSFIFQDNYFFLPFLQSSIDDRTVCKAGPFIGLMGELPREYPREKRFAIEELSFAITDGHDSGLCDDPLSERADY